MVGPNCELIDIASVIAPGPLPRLRLTLDALEAGEAEKAEWARTTESLERKAMERATRKVLPTRE